MNDMTHLKTVIARSPIVEFALGSLTTRQSPEKKIATSKYGRDLASANELLAMTNLI
jgi:hypothetical protein